MTKFLPEPLVQIYRLITRFLIGSGIATTLLRAEEVKRPERTVLPGSQQAEQSLKYASPITRDTSQSMRDHMILKMGKPDPYVETAQNAVFERPDGRDWICCHYWLQGKAAVRKELSGLIPIYEGTQEQLGIEPLLYENGSWRVNGPTWEPQEVNWTEDAHTN